MFKNLLTGFIIKFNEKVLLDLSNLNPKYAGYLNADQEELLKQISERLEPSRFITRKGRIVHAIKSLDEVSLWSVIEARRADSVMAMIKAWCGNWAPDTIADMVKASKFIHEELERADEFENMLFQGLKTDGGSGDKDELRMAENIYHVVSLVAELLRCNFDEAKKMDYSDSMLAISIRAHETEKLKNKNK